MTAHGAASDRGEQMADLTWLEYRDRLAAGAAVIIPVGSLEQHGPHLPLDTDAYIAARIADAVALRTGSLVAPTIVYGYKSQALSGGGQIFCGTTSLSGQTLTALVRDVLGELLRHGASRLVLINAHGENTFFLYEGVDLALRDRPGVATQVLVVNWWELITPATLDDLFAGSFPGWNLEHAAIIETSLMLALAPERVRADRITDEEMAFVPAYAVFPQPDGLVPASGLLSRARPATAQIGRSLLDIIVAESARAMARTFASLH